MKCSILSIFLLLQTFAVFADINKEWYFKRGELGGENLTAIEGVGILSSDINVSKIKAAGFEVVDIPHTFIPSGDTDIYRDQKEDVVYQGDGWYYKALKLPKNLRHKRLFLRFGAVYLDSDIYVNGKHIGNHAGGYSAFIFEITNCVKLGETNSIVVRTSNELSNDINPIGGGYVKFGGIVRPVELIIKEAICISPTHFASRGVYCKPLKVSERSADITIETLINSEVNSTDKCEVKCSIIDRHGSVVTHAERSLSGVEVGESSVEMAMSVSNPELWDGLNNPAMYDIEVKLYRNGDVVDTVIERTGFKYVSVDRDKGFFLNGKSYPLRGVALHQYYPGVGSAMTKEHFDEDMAGILDLGANAVRLSHYPHSEYRLDKCDEAGIVSFSEVAWIKEFFGTAAFNENLDQQLQEMIYQLYNHPSIAIWGLFNEIRFDTFKGVDGVKIVERINSIAKSADPYRMTCGVSWLSGERNDCADLSGWNRYQGWYWNAYGGSAADFSWIDRIRKNNPHLILGITEYGGGGAINHFDENSRRAPYNSDQFHPVDFYNYSHEEHIKQIDKRPWLWGTFIWTINEFLVPDYNQGRATFIHDKGLVSEDRMEKKDVYFLYKANWRKDVPVFHLAYKKFVNRLQDDVEVTVYSNLDNATLSVNGVDYGTLRNADYSIYRWGNIKLRSGDNSVIVTATDKDGNNYVESCVWHLVEEINNDDNFAPIINIGSTWNVQFKDEIDESRVKKGTGVPGEEINARFNADADVWINCESWDSVKFPLEATICSSDGDWEGAQVYLRKDFEVANECNNPYLCLLQTATMSTNNSGRITIAIDGVAVLTQEEGAEHYRLIPIEERLGSLSKGNHTISVIANKPVMNGVLDIGLFDMK